jgi:hypothetical protein
MSEQRAERCETCRFWEPISPESGDGYCRRYPPIATGFSPDVEAAEPSVSTRAFCYWPETDHTDWCGEWQSMSKGRIEIPLARIECLSSRTLNILERMGIYTTDDLAGKTAKELMRDAPAGFGKKCLSETMEAIRVVAHPSGASSPPT